MRFLAVIDQKIDGVAPLWQVHFVRRTGLKLEALGRLGHINSCFGEPMDQATKSWKLLRQVFQRRTNDLDRDTPIEFLELCRELCVRVD